MPETPNYRIRYSPRARRIRLRICAENGLVATLPRGTPVRMLHAFLDEQREWIDKSLKELQPLREQLEAQRSSLPETLELRAIGRRMEIHFQTGPRYRLTEQQDRLVLHGPDKDADQCYKVLGRYLRTQARTHLGVELARIAETHDLAYTSLCIRRQKTRWGSCSARGRINLNDKLLFLPPTLMRHVLLHELAHTRHLNHSPAFYRLLHTLDPETETHRRALAQAGAYVPLWLRWAS